MTNLWSVAIFSNRWQQWNGMTCPTWNDFGFDMYITYDCCLITSAASIHSVYATVMLISSPSSFFPFRNVSIFSRVQSVSLKLGPEPWFTSPSIIFHFPCFSAYHCLFPVITEWMQGERWKSEGWCFYPSRVTSDKILDHKTAPKVIRLIKVCIKVWLKM